MPNCPPGLASLVNVGGARRSTQDPLDGMANSGLIRKIAAGTLGALSLFTTVWVGWELAAHGDSMGNSGAALPSLFGAVLIGFALGFRFGATALFYLLVVLGLASLAYWFLVPSGWWITPPPRNF